MGEIAPRPLHRQLQQTRFMLLQIEAVLLDGFAQAALAGVAFVADQAGAVHFGAGGGPSAANRLAF